MAEGVSVMAEKINRGNVQPGSVGHNLEPGMNHEQQRKDAAGYSTDLDMLTGGILCDAMMGGGPEVGNAYDKDPLGENRHMVTFTDEVMPEGGMGMGGGSDSNDR